ncbi:MAG: tetratricopeptide repeat protein, partial [Lachnospiraceae bacterium]|nr:tetratricopeptide repeat protein [Lachnospiraceae bacterium]
MDTKREERYIEEIKRCMQEGNNAELLETLNEYIGFLREFERFEEGYKISEQILALLKEMGLEGSLSYATSLLNIATLLRAGGRFEDSLSLYKDVEVLYDKLLPKDAMLRASFHNNRSLLYQEMGKIKESIDELSKAL